MYTYIYTYMSIMCIYIYIYIYEVEYLVDAAVRASALLEETDWAAKLSLGEQQRLGIARV